MKWRELLPVGLRGELRDGARQIAKQRRVKVVCHRGPDPDAFGVAEGLAETARRLGVEVAGIFHAGTPTPLAASLQCKSRPLSELPSESDAAVLLGDASDCNDVHVLGDSAKGTVEEPELVLDHHEGPVSGRMVIRHFEGGSASILTAALMVEVLAGGSLEAVLEQKPHLATCWALAAATDANLYMDGTPVTPQGARHPVAEEFLRYLLPFADRDILEGIKRQQADPVYQHLLALAREKLMENVLPHGRMFSAMLPSEVPDIAMVGRAADEVRDRSVEGSVVVLGGLILDNGRPHLAVSVRTDGVVDASEFVQEAFHAGGGRRNASGARIPIEKRSISEATVKFSQGIRRMAA